MIPVIPVRQIVSMPGIETNIILGREFSINAAIEAKDNDDKIVLVLQKDVNKMEISTEDLNEYGVVAKITNVTKAQNGTYNIFVKGLSRVKIKNCKFDENDKVYRADITLVKTRNDIPADMLNHYTPDKLLEVSGPLLADKNVFKFKTPNQNYSIEDLKTILDLLVYFVVMSPESKQKYLEIRSLKDRIDAFVSDAEAEKQKINLEEKLNDKLKANIDENQKNYYLKEKMKVIKEELGEDNDNLIASLSERIEKKVMPDGFKDKLNKELKKLENIPPFSAEYNVTINYIEVLLDLPFEPSQVKDIEIKKAKKILDEDHYGLKDVKDTILEYLAVMQLKEKAKKSSEKKFSTILCLVGPPGIGKTSLASSIARAMNRKFAKISLGGVDDESEIRGHRRTYVGAMPGRIIEAIKRTGVNNPVILLDEIDKVDSSYRGDPASALLEVLDPSQNVEFEDHFVDYPYDLSNVVFICTANNYMGIPEPLYDRLEVINIESYTELEKLNIVKEYLIKQVKEETEIKLNLTDETILKLINSYTREAGVRNLKRELTKLARKAARESLEKGKTRYTVKISDLEKYLGPETYKPEKVCEKEPKIGRVNGLAWTSVGGTTLEVQAVKMDGDGKLILTGKLGDVMQESAKVAYSFVRSITPKDNEFYKDSDIHLHFPEGAVPKDGPSAGITITTAILSVVLNRKVRQDIAMTGEITITGDVLPIGGVKEKVIAAHRIGIREVILPIDNEVDAKQLPEEIKKDMKFNFVSKYWTEVSNVALVKGEGDDVNAK